MLGTSTEIGSGPSTTADLAPQSIAAAPAAKRWSPTWMTGKKSFTRAEAVALAERFDVVVGHPHVLRPWVGAMHAANPSVQVLAYINGAYTKRTTYPEAYYAHDRFGRRIKWSTFDLWMLELSNPDARAAVRSIAQAAKNRASFDGFLLDNLGLTSVNDSDKTGVPVVPTTGVAYSGREWLQQSTKQILDFRTDFPALHIMANGIGRGDLYFSPDRPTSVLSVAATSTEPEQFVRSAMDNVNDHRSVEDWKLDVDMIVDSEQKGTPMAAVTKLWTPATAAQKSQWHKFALASFLLATDGTSWFNFFGDREVETATADSSLEKIAIGTPMGDYTPAGTMFKRLFSNGMALVNPTDNAASVTLSGIYTRSDGAPVSGSITLPAHSGEILKSV